MNASANRLTRVVPNRGPALIVPVDDSLISGPEHGLEKLGETFSAIADSAATGVLGFPGQFAQHGGRLARRPDLGWIMNVTASLSGPRHIEKVQIHSVERAARLGCDAVAVHINASSQHEHRMLVTAGKVFDLADEFGLAKFAIIYPRRRSPSGEDDNYEGLRDTDGSGFERLVARCARLGSDLGADVVKTRYTGDKDSFSRVCAVASPTPLIIAGGPLLPASEAATMAADAYNAGASGISFGRNVWGRPEVVGSIRLLQEAMKNA